MPQAHEADPPGPDPGLEVTHLIGGVAGLIRASVLATLTEAQQAAVIRSLDGGARTLAEQAPAPGAWVPTADLAALLAEAKRVSPVRTERARAQLEADLVMEGAGWPATPGALIEALPRIFGQVHRGGRVSVGALRPGEALLVLAARYPYPEWYAEVLPRWIQHALSRSGASGASVLHLPPGAGEAPWLHRYQVRWTSE